MGLLKLKRKMSFLAELVGVDFNIIRNPLEKNNNRYNNTWSLLFNAIIETMNLKEFEMSGRKFTRANYAYI